MGGGGTQTTLDKVKLMVGMQPDNEPDFFQEIDEYVSLSKTQRLYGFLISVGLGITLNILSLLFYFNLTMFASLYTMGNILSLCSTGFLVGPWAQVKNMFVGYRVGATIMYFTSMAATLYFAIVVGSGFLALICVCVQSFALTW
eukprot:CAMPEP_0197851706 /NCGR_PEP_ID=MMETSP1438-20131217/18668_1 /TAXON_ID=1461541 /ORGANISM="Pterosperma sp., Strain CCMP1384" /LENGTH=143 /DNA_ID=CAMNT_0043465413 /DNA_START=274 /DNA_END=702 /DNA_ORIENTATION=-